MAEPQQAGRDRGDAADERVGDVRAVRGVLAYLADEDCVTLATGEAAALVGRRRVMRDDGRLAAPGAHGRPVRPYLFLGRAIGGRPAYLCHALEPAGER